MSDAFSFHPELRERIKPSKDSFFRDLSVETFVAMLKKHDLDTSWLRTEAEIDAVFQSSLDEYPGGDLWIFGYGSLMWDPGFLYDEVRYAHLPNYQRSFCLVDTGGARGNVDTPGLMAALDHGGFCDGIAFRVPEALVAAEMRQVFWREAIAPAYHPAFVPVEIGSDTDQALIFVADPTAPMIDRSLNFDQQAQLMGTGKGFLGTSLEYIENLSENLSALGIVDEHVQELLEASSAVANNQ